MDQRIRGKEPIDRAARYRGSVRETVMTKQPTKQPTSSEDAVPQSDKQLHTNIAQHEGQEGAQAKVINQQEAEKRQDNKK